MTELERIEIKERLEKELIETDLIILKLKELTKPIAPENSIGRVSRMDAINNKSVNEAALRTALKKLNLLKEAKGKINQKDFGFCILCKNSISHQRILLIPQANRCIHCASR
tara:strand:+ start:1927 stop:2262 length:336 start_codon:yes stop_codon:yes gene_type:complete